MTITMFEASVPSLITMMNGVSHCLEKGAIFAKEKGLDEKVLTEARLAPDMLPLKSQVYILTDHAKGCMARLTGEENPVYEDNEQTIEELKARLAKCMAHISSFTPAQIDGSENKPINIKIGSYDLNFKGREYLLGFAMPNFYFHVTTAYNILRHNGVPLGKADFFGQ
jgi:uncharacterized protein